MASRRNGELARARAMAFTKSAAEGVSVTIVDLVSGGTAQPSVTLPRSIYMVSSEFLGANSRLPGLRLASLPGRGDGVGAALRSATRADRVLPDEMMKLLKALDRVTSSINGCD